MERRLEEIIHFIQTAKEPVTITKRELVEGLGYQKRTTWNCYHIDNYLSSNLIVADGNYKKGYIDESLTLSFKYTINSDNFQLYSLHIKDQYKNLSDFYVDFSESRNCCCLIGLNGSGKSNVLEAISAIFYSLYQIATLPNGLRKYPCDFSYTIQYILRGEFYQISDGVSYNGKKITLEMLPKNIIASYSGEDRRLWEKYYKPIYDKHCSRITAIQGFTPPFLLYIDRQEWNISLLTLLYSEDIDVVAFINSILVDRSCKITFQYNNTNLRKWEGTDVEAFVEKLKEHSDYDIPTFRDTINEIAFIDQASTLFYYLYKCTTSEENRVISKITIQFENVFMEDLSEGEKKMIIVNTIMHLLATNESFCLFDEPDSHVHISRKQELLNLINTENRFSLLTTHSPSMIGHVSMTNIRHMANGQIINSKRLQQIRDLSGGEINYIDGAFVLSAKNILVTEGKYDIRYLKHAISVFGKRDPQYYKLNKIAFIHGGSAGNCQALFEEVLQESLPCVNKIVFLFDYDKGGLDGWKNIKTIADVEPKVVPIFYQENYTKDVDTTLKDVSPNDSYMVEDLFAQHAYQSEVDYYHSMNTHKEFRANSKGKATDAIKNYIEKNYLKFDDADYSKFEPVLKKLITLFNL